MTSLVPRLVSCCAAVATQAGGVIRAVLKKGDLGIVQKEHIRDLQTEADRAAQRLIIGSLQQMFPKATIIGEEEEEGGSTDLVKAEAVTALECEAPQHLASLQEDQVVIWVDPLDGTSEYTQGLLDHVTVLIGIAAHGKTIAGVIHQPYHNYQHPEQPQGRTVWGVVGGAWGGMRLQAPPSDGRVVATTRSHASSSVNDAVAACAPSSVLRVGGAGHKVLLLLTGEAHAYVFASPGCKKWDTCAPQAVLEAAGGRLTDIGGRAIPYDKDAPHRNSEGVLATAPGESHEQYVNFIPESVKTALIA